MNRHIALRFEGRPDLHMTLRYYSQKDAVERALKDAQVLVQKAKWFSFEMVRERWLGRNHDIRTLTVPWTALPDWLINFAGQGGWIAHVTTEEKSLNLRCNAIAVMQKKQEIVRWQLT